jgi:SAM-dependent methyltransferase
MSAPYRDFYYPLNVFMHILTREEGGVDYLHYGLFTRPDESIASAQERSTALLFERLPPPPARILDVGAGLGTTLARLTERGYQAVGITPDDKQVAMIRGRFGSEVRIENKRFETIDENERFDCVVFQESSQYIDAQSLFAKAGHVTHHVIVLDEFAVADAEGLHSYAQFLDSAARHRFRKIEEIDVSQQAAPTIDYFRKRIPRYRQPLMEDLGISSAQVDDLIASGERYRDLYNRGVYAYRLMQFRRER